MAECLETLGPRFKARGPCQVQTIWNGREDRIKAGADGCWLARQCDDQAAPAQPRLLTGQDCCWHIPEAGASHLFAKSGQEPVADARHRFRSYIPGRRPRAAGHQDQITGRMINKIYEGVCNYSLFIRHKTIFALPGTFQDVSQIGLDAGPDAS